MMYHNIYATEHGNVAISDREAAILQSAEDLRRLGSLPAFAEDVLAKANAIAAACNRVARFKAEGTRD